jgi:hypothetical protein
MQPAGARILREDEQQDLTREAVLLQWERKIEEAERAPRPAEDATREPPRRFARDAAEDATHEPPRRFARDAAEDATHDAPSRFPRRAVTLAPVADRRTITITGQAAPAPRRRPSLVESQLAQPDRIALWAFLLGLFLVVVAAGTAHA